MIKTLIVDDKIENLYLMEALLDSNGFKTTSAKNGAEALGLLRNFTPDLIISDILMPVMDGFTLCRECKKDMNLNKIPFFFYTATYTDARDEEFALSLGADMFILKPQEPDVLVKILNDSLEALEKKTMQTKETLQHTDTVVLKEYNEVLIRKIEDKMIQSEKAEKELRRYSEVLEKEISDRKLYEKELVLAKEKAEESDRLKSAFLHNISHEVRTPMNAIEGFSDLVIDSELAPEIRDEYLHTIIRASKQLLTIINQIVTMATIEAGQVKISEKEISLNSTLKLLFNQFSDEIVQKNIIIHSETGLNDNDDLLITDESKLIQILTNLLGNAWKFTKEGSIDFGYKVKGKFLEFFVKDTGIGIPSEMHEIIFERFRQVESKIAREFDGSGLGLSISKAYVSILGGEIWLNSMPGTGTIFYFTIPYKKANPATNRKSDSLLQSKSSTKGNTAVLVAEDEYFNYTLLEKFLLNAGMQVIHAMDGAEAVEICMNNSEIDLVLMDLKMPEMDGFEATRIIKKFRPDLPIVAQTAYSQDVDREKALECGCSDFISKPYKRDAILALIKKYFPPKPDY